jgi:hypothetical protein
MKIFSNYVRWWLNIFYAYCCNRQMWLIFTHSFLLLMWLITYVTWFYDVSFLVSNFLSLCTCHLGYQEISLHQNGNIFILSEIRARIYVLAGVLARTKNDWCGDKTVAMNVGALQQNSCLYRQLFFFQYRKDFTETACVCALLLRIRPTQKATLGTSTSQ